MMTSRCANCVLIPVLTCRLQDLTGGHPGGVRGGGGTTYGDGKHSEEGPSHISKWKGDMNGRYRPDFQVARGRNLAGWFWGVIHHK